VFIGEKLLLLFALYFYPGRKPVRECHCNHHY